MKQSGNKTRDDEIYEQGVHDGQKADLVDQFSHNLVKNYTLNPRENEIYNKGYEYGINHRPEKNTSSYETLTSSYDSSTYSPNSNTSDGESSDILVKIIGFIIVVILAIWLLINVAIPLLVINIALILFILGLTQKRYNKILYPLSILGSIYIAIDYNKGLFTKALVNNVSFLDGLIPILFFINISAGLIATYFLIRDILNKKTQSENEKEFTKRNLIIMSSLLVIGIMVIVFIKRYNVENTVLAQPILTREKGIISDSEQLIDGKIKAKVNEYLQRNMQSSVEYVSSLYAEKVDFYNSGIVTKDFIRDDKTKYFSKWPERNMQLMTAINVDVGSIKDTWIATFDYHFAVANSRRSVQGKAWCKLIYQLDNNTLVIISEKGKVYNR